MYVVLGGGIAGISCAQQLVQLLSSSEKVMLISGSEVLKEAIGVMKVTQAIDNFTVFESSIRHFQVNNPNIIIIQGIVKALDPISKTISLENGQTIPYYRVCVCTGGIPKLIHPTHPNIIGIRDLESVSSFIERLRHCRHIILVGNGGIALELVFALSEWCKIEWIIRDDNIGSVFFDREISQFISHSKLNDSTEVPQETVDQHEDEGRFVSKGSAASSSLSLPVISDISSFAIGPHWDIKADLLKHKQQFHLNDTQNRNLVVHCQQEITAIYDSTVGCWNPIDGHTSLNKYPSIPESNQSDIMHVLTSANNIVSGDFVVCAIGVSPCTQFLSNDFIRTTIDNSIIVNENMMTNVHDVYAAGDCCYYLPQVIHHQYPIHGCEKKMFRNSQDYFRAIGENTWFQMRLWGQAREMGKFAALQMVNNEETHDWKLDQVREINYNDLDFTFEIFTHMTYFFGYKVILLGRYNCQGLDVESEIIQNQFILTDDNQTIHIIKDCNVLCDIQSNIMLSRDCSILTSRLLHTKEKIDVEVWTRVKSGKEFVKIVVYRGRVIGATIVGNADEFVEVLENLILNRIHVTQYGLNLLNPNIDIEDYFD